MVSFYMVQMEKYCTKCNKIYNDMKAKFCTNCATELIAREKRKPIPSELRHQIFVRDGYRCRECGKSKNDGISLEIDHIFPLSKGGSTTPDNLWTLCRDCNQAKKDDVWKDDEIEITKNELKNLKNQLHEAEDKLKQSTNKDEILDYKFKIKKIKKEYIPQVQNKLNKLIQEETKLKAERKAQQNENKRKERLFKKLYVELDDELLKELCVHCSLKEASTEDNLRTLINNYSEQEIFGFIEDIQIKNEEIKRKKRLYDELSFEVDNKILQKVFDHFQLNKSSTEDNLRLLINKYDEQEIYNQIKIERKIKEREEILSNEDINQLKKDFTLNENDFYEMLSEMDTAQLKSLKDWLKRKYPNGYW